MPLYGDVQGNVENSAPLGTGPEIPDLSAIEVLLSRCSPRELRLAEKVLQLFLLRSDL